MGGASPSPPTLSETIPGDEGTLGPAAPRGPRTPAPARIGRFVVLERIGVGGMGVVYTAIDPELDRKVAIKLVRFARASSTREARLRREAQALARLSHPNVVQVFDVGPIDDGLYVAMEYVDGQPLGAWLEAAARSAAEIVGVFVQAGRGLAAAHDAGLVHRDFKPDNVLVTTTGRVVVLDFGLAHAFGDTRARSDVDTRAESLSSGITRDGALIGTPRYMSPEQFASRPTDARSDQYGFCVALWEALYRQHPTPSVGEGAMALGRAVLAGELRPPPAGHRAPAAIEPVLRRGLSRVPDDRYRQMSSLLDELARAVKPRRWPLAAAVGVVLMLGAAVAGTRPSSSACAADEQIVAGVWDDAARASIRAAFERTGVPYAEDAFGRVTVELDDYSEQWIAVHREACEQPDDLLDRRMECLARGRREFSAAVTILAAGDATTLHRSVSIATSLPPVTNCTDRRTLGAAFEPPPAEVRNAVDRIDALLADATAHDRAGDPVAALELTARAVELAEAAGYPPVLAAAAQAHGDALRENLRYEEAKETLTRAYHLAVAAHDDRTAARAAVVLMNLVGVALEDPDDGFDWARRAEARLDALSRGPTDVHATFFLHRSGLYDVTGRLDEALADAERALDIATELDFPAHKLANVRSSTGGLLLQQGKLDEALVAMRRTAAEMEEAFGPNHPRLASAINNVAAVLHAQGDLEGALAGFERGARIQEAVFGPRSPALASMLNNIGVILQVHNESERARDIQLRVIEIYEELYQSDHARLAQAYSNLAWTYADLRDAAAAREYFTKAIAAHEALGNHDAPGIVNPREGLAWCHEQDGNVEAALSLLSEGIEIRRRHLGRDHHELAEIHQRAGETLVRHDRISEALPHLREALRIRRIALPATHRATARTLERLAHVLLELGRSEGALPLLEEFRELPPERQGPPDRRARAYFNLARVVRRTDPTRADELLTEAAALVEDEELAARIDALQR